MIQQITIYNKTGEKIGITFPKRAKQLVNKQKAQWADELHTKIYLISAESQEDNNKLSDKSQLDNSYDDEKLLELAVKKVKRQNRLICHLVIYILSLICLVILNENGFYFTMPIFIIFTLIFVVHIIYFLLPNILISLKHLLLHLKHLNQYRITLEYEKLKKRNSGK